MHCNFGKEKSQQQLTLQSFNPEISFLYPFMMEVNMNSEFGWVLTRARSNTYKSTPFASADTSVNPKPKSMRHREIGEVDSTFNNN